MTHVHAYYTRMMAGTPTLDGVLHFPSPPFYAITGNSLYPLPRSTDSANDANLLISIRWFALYIPIIRKSSSAFVLDAAPVLKFCRWYASRHRLRDAYIYDTSVARCGSRRVTRTWYLASAGLSQIPLGRIARFCAALSPCFQPESHVTIRCIKLVPFLLFPPFDFSLS